MVLHGGEGGTEEDGGLGLRALQPSPALKKGRQISDSVDYDVDQSQSMLDTMFSDSEDVPSGGPSTRNRTKAKSQATPAKTVLGQIKGKRAKRG